VLVRSLKGADHVYIAGEAGSHCVKATTEHLVEQLSDAERAKLVLVTDCMSPVAGFEEQYRDFVQRMQALGVRTATSAEVLRELLADAA
jgi:nicotinamidase/pyrazinamidase